MKKNLVTSLRFSRENVFVHSKLRSEFGLLIWNDRLYTIYLATNSHKNQLWRHWLVAAWLFLQLWRRPKFVSVDSSCQMWKQSTVGQGRWLWHFSLEWNCNDLLLRDKSVLNMCCHKDVLQDLSHLFLLLLKQVLSLFKISPIRNYPRILFITRLFQTIRLKLCIQSWYSIHWPTR